MIEHLSISFLNEKSDPQFDSAQYSVTSQVHKIMMGFVSLVQRLYEKWIK